MALTVLKGLTGAVTLPHDENGNAIGGKLNAIDISGGQELADISSFGGTGWRERTGLLKDLAGSASGFLAQELSPGFDTISDTAGTMTVVFKTGYQAVFPAIIGQIQSQMRYDGVSTVNFQWVQSGAPTITWVGSS